MRAKTQNMVFLVVLAVLAAGGYFLHTLAQKSLREELTEQRMKVEAELKKVQRAGVEAKADVYHTNVHAFDLMQDDDISRQAIEGFDREFAYAMEHYAEDGK